MHWPPDSAATSFPPLAEASTASLDVSLRPETPEDEQFLFDLYATTRDYEMNLIPWSESQKRAFLDQQCSAQLQHYRHHYADASFQIILLNGVRVGRIYLHRTEQEICLVDISLMREYRGAGIGTWLTQQLLRQAEAHGQKVSLHVEVMNPARRLYERLGFHVTEDKGIYLRMQWERPMMPRT